MNYGDDAARWQDRASSMFDRAEQVYLRILRGMILIIATLMIVFVLWLASSSLYKMSRSADSVEEAAASVEPTELLDAQVSEPAMATVSPAERSASPAQRRFYADFVTRYYQLYKMRFEPFRQAEDKRLSRDEFDDNFVDSEAKLEAIGNGELDFTQDSADLRNLLTVMTTAAEDPQTRARLEKYRMARKVRVNKKVERTRTEVRRGWDSYATHCPGWYEAPIGCAVQRTVKVPYTQTVTSMEFPKGTQSHTDIFRAFQDRYFSLLGERRQANAARAQAERSAILAGNAEGSSSLFTAAQIFGAFLALMFFFLLIAIERHQRRIATQSAQD